MPNGALIRHAVTTRCLLYALLGIASSLTAKEFWVAQLDRLDRSIVVSLLRYLIVWSAEKKSNKSNALSRPRRLVPVPDVVVVVVLCVPRTALPLPASAPITWVVSLAKR